VPVGTNGGMAPGVDGSRREGYVNHPLAVSAGLPTASIFSLSGQIALAGTCGLVEAAF
jgi:hypothetical protein